MNRVVLVILGCAFMTGAQQPEEAAHLRFARDVFGEAVKSARAITESSERDYALSAIAKPQARSTSVAEAVSTTALTHELRESALVDVASIAANRGEYEAAMRVVQGEGLFTQDGVGCCSPA